MCVTDILVDAFYSISVTFYACRHRFDSTGIDDLLGIRVICIIML